MEFLLFCLLFLPLFLNLEFIMIRNVVIHVFVDGFCLVFAPFLTFVSLSCQFPFCVPEREEKGTNSLALHFCLKFQFEFVFLADCTFV